MLNPDIPLIDDERYATILPLDYTDDRSENTLLYFSGRWSDLAKLLTDPIRFFNEEQERWDKANPGGTPWNLRGPVTAILRPATEEPRSSAVLATFAQKSRSTKLELQGLQGDIGEGSQVQSFQQIFDKTLEDGAFFAEYALCTSILTIHYWEPKPRMNVQGDPEDQPDIYAGGLTRAVLGFMPTNAPHQMGTLHFDLDEKNNLNGIVSSKSSWEDRADFIVECLQIQNRLGQRLDKVDVLQGDAKLRRATEAITVRKEPLKSVPNKDGVVKEQGAVFKPIFQRPEGGRRPSVIAERLSDYGDPQNPPPPCRACCTSGIYETYPGSGVWMLGDIVVKCYIACQ